VGYDYTLGQGGLRFKATSLQSTVSARLSSITSSIRDINHTLADIDPQFL
jgi:hypothetical protein